MVSWANNIASTAQSFAVIVQIEGVTMYLSDAQRTAAGSDDRIRFCSQIPDYASSQADGLWRDYLTKFPPMLAERVDSSQGGFPTMGALEFSILDYDDYLTDQLRVEALPSTTVATAVSSKSATSVVVTDDAEISTTDVIWIGPECMRVTNVSSNTLTVTRGYAGTEAQLHSVGAFVHLYPQYLRGRRVEVSLAPINGSSSDETSLGTWVIDSLSWDQKLNIWTFGAKSELKYLHRAVPPMPSQSYTVSEVREKGKTYKSNIGDREDKQKTTVFRVGLDTLPDWSLWGATIVSYKRNFNVKVGDGIYACYSNTSTDNASANMVDFYVLRDGIAGSKRGIPSENDRLSRVMVADDDGDFRFYPGGSPATARTTSGWESTSNWLDIIAIILMSSPDSTDDTYVANNYTASAGNYASLAAGYGIGLPTSKFDWTAFANVRDRTREQNFPNFYFGDERVPFGELIDHHFLKPLGAYFSTADGLAKIILPAAPWTGQASVTIGETNILTTPVAGGAALPRMDIQYGLSNIVKSLIYEIGPNKQPLRISAEGPLDERRFYAAVEDAVKIQAPGANPEEAVFLEEAMLRKLFRQHRPQMLIGADVDMNSHSIGPGDLVEVTVNEAPALGTGSRGWTSVQAEVKSRTVKVEPDGGAYVRLEAQAYSQSLKVGRITPAAYITGVVTNTATVRANYYTAPDANNDLPVKDCSAFTEGDIVRLVDTAGVDQGGTTQTINTITPGSNSIELDGNFGGNLAANLILVYANYSEATANTQQSDWAWQASSDAAPMEVASGVDPWVYGDS